MTSRRELAEQLPQLLERAVPQPPTPLDTTSMRAAGNRSPRRWSAPAFAALVVVALAVTVAVIVARRPDHPTDGAVGHHPGVAAINVQRRAATETALERLLASFSVPSTWRPSAHSLSKDVTRPTDRGHTYQVDRARLWVTTATAAAALSYLTSHLPPDVTVGAPATNATATFASALFTPRGRWTNSIDYGGMDISAFAERLKSGSVGVEIEASAFWLPLRTPAQIIPASVTGGRVVIRAELSRGVHRFHLTAVEARTLAGRINGLAVTYAEMSSCPVTGPSATITFASPAGPQTVTVYSFCPSSVVVEPRTSGMEIDLEPGHVFTGLLSMLGLPPNFGRR